MTLLRRAALVLSLSACIPACAQVPRIGVLFPDEPAARAAMLAALGQGLREQGLEPGKDVLVDPRYANGSPARLAAEAETLASDDSAVIVAAGTAPAMAAARATTSKPIVIVGVGDPVARGLAASMQRPGRNVTGSTDLLPDAAKRRIVLLRSLLPAMRKLAVISNPAITDRMALDAAADAFGLSLRHLDVRAPADFAQVYAAMRAEPPDALIVTPNPTTFAERHSLAAFGREQRIAVLFGWVEFSDAPGLAVLGASLQQLYRAAAAQVTLILRGAKPAEMPIDLPRYALVLNRGTARVLGIELPDLLVAQADKVFD
jgi:putative ABC transport system substrate-binding protein